MEIFEPNEFTLFDTFADAEMQVHFSIMDNMNHTEWLNRTIQRTLKEQCNNFNFTYIGKHTIHATNGIVSIEIPKDESIDRKLVYKFTCNDRVNFIKNATNAINLIDREIGDNLNGEFKDDHIVLNHSMFMSRPDNMMMHTPHGVMCDFIYKKTGDSYSFDVYYSFVRLDLKTTKWKLQH